MLINIILSGGAGTRLWPLSTPMQPKQFIALIKGRSLFQECLRRNMDFVQSTIVVLHKDHFEVARQQSRELDIQHCRFIVEEVPRNTAPAITMAALDCKPKDILFVTPADHVIDTRMNYLQALVKAVRMAEDGDLVTFGIKPSYAETGYGYIEHAGSRVISFHEKPARDVAAEYLEKGGFLWNSGMFCFRADSYLKAMETFQPTLLKSCQMIRNLQKRKEPVPLSLYELLPSISIDHAIMEQAENISVVPSQFDWTDIGSFDALCAYLQKENEIHHNHVYTTADALEHNFVFNQAERPIAIVGVQDIIVIQTEAGMLICKKGESQQVKEVFPHLMQFEHRNERRQDLMPVGN